MLPSLSYVFSKLIPKISGENNVFGDKMMKNK